MTHDRASLMMSWQPPPEIDRNGIITGYIIEYTRLGGSSGTVTVFSGTTRLIPDLVPFVQYSVRVAAMSNNGSGPFSDTVVQTSGQDSKLNYKLYIFSFMHFPVPIAPQSLTVNSVTDTTVTLSWSPPDPTNGVITLYELQYKRCADGNYNTRQPLNNAIPRTVIGLDVGTEYCFRVRAYTVESFGGGEWSDNVTGRTCKLHVIQIIIIM